MGFGYGFDSSFGMTFGIMQVIVPIMFVLVFGIILVTLIRGIGEWNKNNRSPKLTVPAAVVSRRTDVSHHHHRHHGNEMHHTHTSTSYYVTFQVESGDRMEFAVSGMEYGLLAEGDTGDLTFQGTRYLNFQRATRE